MIQFASAKNISATIRQVEQVNIYIDCYIILNVIALKKWRIVKTMKVAVDHFGAHMSYILVFFFLFFALAYLFIFLNDTCFWLDLETANTLFVMVHYAAFAGPDLLSSSKQLVTLIPVSGARLFFGKNVGEKKKG